MQIATLIMAGGHGQRLWPIGRRDKPKQFLKIKSENTLIEEAIIRAKTFCDEQNIFIITGTEYKDSFYNLLPNFPKDNIIFEPSKRDTAAAIAFGIYTIEQKLKDAIVVALPSDPFIENIERFTAVINKAIQYAAEQELAVLIGISTNRAETSYGYIHTSDCISGEGNIKVYKVDRFVEKPNKEKAEVLYKDKSYLWNSGMFIWKSSVALSYIKNLEPLLYEKVVNTYHYIANNELENAKTEFDSIEKKSIDFAIMEKITESLCVEGDFIWDDVGTFSALSRVYRPDENGNLKIGDNCLLNTENTTIVNNDENTFVAVYGMKDIVVVNHNGVTLIYPKGDDDMIKALMSEIEQSGKTKYL